MYFTFVANKLIMTKSQKESIEYLSRNNGVLELFNSEHGIIIARHDNGVDSIGIRGGITQHFYKYNNKLYKNGSWAYK